MVTFKVRIHANTFLEDFYTLPDRIDCTKIWYEDTVSLWFHSLIIESLKSIIISLFPWMCDVFRNSWHVIVSVSELKTKYILPGWPKSIIKTALINHRLEENDA